MSFTPKPLARALRKSAGAIKQKSIPLALGIAFIAGGQIVNAEGASWREGRILVKPRAGIPQAELEKILQRHGGKKLGRLKNLDVHIIEVPAQAEAAVAKALSRNPHIKFAEKDMLMETDAALPNDPRLGSAWHLNTVQAPAAWEAANGIGVTIAILDSGVDGSHPDLAAKMVSGWNSASNNTDTSDIFGHGTKVAGSAAAATDNGIGVSAVGWNAQIMPVRITNRTDGYAYASDMAAGLTWAADHGADLANVSFNASSSSTVASAAQYMRNKGGLVIMAAGNNGSDPGYSDNAAIFAVSATGASDVKTSWSNYGNYIDIAGPGSQILTTTRGGGYSAVSGTSFASPVVAGVAALVLSANPGLSPGQVESIIEASADDLVAGTDWHPYYGHGRVNAVVAVQMALNTVSAPVDTEAPVATIFSPGNNTTVSGLVAIDVNATDNEDVTQVALFYGEQLIGVDSTSPYQFTWDSTQAADGAVTVTAMAYDAADNAGISQDVTLMVDNVVEGPADTTAPTVSFPNLTDGGEVSGNKVTIQVAGSDNVAVRSISLSIDGITVGTVTGGSMSYSWNTRKVSNGAHVIAAQVMDTSGNSTTKSIQVNLGTDTTTGGPKGKGKGKR